MLAPCFIPWPNPQKTGTGAPTQHHFVFCIRPDVCRRRALEAIDAELPLIISITDGIPVLIWSQRYEVFRKESKASRGCWTELSRA